jgi:DNA-binding MarR family transcriptional regulator
MSDPNVKLELSEHLPYLFKHIHAQLQAASAGQLAQFGVDVAVWRILAVLWQHGDLSHRELSDLTSIEVSTLSRVSKAVKRDGLIRRTRTQEDQRTVRVTLTEKGRAVTQAIIPSALQVQANIVGNLSAEDVKSLTRILHVIVENLNAYSKTDPDIEADSVQSSCTSKANGILEGPADPGVKSRSIEWGG